MKNRNVFFICFVTILLFTGILLFISNKNTVLLKAETSNNRSAFSKKNEAILIKTLLINNWLNISELHNNSYKQNRNKIILEIENHIKTNKNKLYKFDDNTLSAIALTYRFLLNSKIKPIDALKFNSLEDLKLELVNINKKHTSYSISQLMHHTLLENLNIAYKWWLPQKNEELISKLNQININNANFKVKDNYNKPTEVLKIIKANETDYKYLGVYHNMVSRNHFKMFLAGSNDLKSWKRITILGNRSHQGDIKKWGNGYILVNEEDQKEGSNNIKVSFFESYNKLCKNESKHSIALPKLFSRFAEGTPDIREIVGETPNESYILLGFHYFNNGDVDYQAFGILKNFKHWKAWKDFITNKNIINMGFKGNIGGRHSFKHLNSNLILQEAQINKNDFSSWQLLLGDGLFYTKLKINTPNKSTSFANPSIVEIKNGTFTVSSFLPSEGNSSHENGQMLYNINLN